MDRQTLETWQTGIDSVEPRISPAFEAVNKRLLGYLAAGGNTFRDLEAQTRNSRNNANFLRDFSLYFPDFDYDADHVPAADEIELRSLMTNLVWFNGDPRLIVGKHRGETGLELLILGFPRPPKAYNQWNRHPRCAGGLAILTNKSPDLKSRLTRKSSDELAEAVAQLDKLRGSEYPSPADIEELYRNHYRSSKVLISPKTPRAVVAEKAVYTPVESIKDEDLGTFDVLSHLTEIVSQLGKTEQLYELIDRYKSNPNTE